jgi:hypothetical protein
MIESVLDVLETNDAEATVDEALHALLWDRLYVGDDDLRSNIEIIKMLLLIEDPAEASNDDPKECHEPDQIVGQRADQNREDTSPKTELTDNSRSNVGRGKCQSRSSRERYAVLSHKAALR